MSNCPYVLYKSDRKKFENWKKVGKMKISILIFIYTVHFFYLKLYTNFKTLAPIGAVKSLTEISIREKEKWTNEGTDMQYVDVFVTQNNSSLWSFVPNFRILTQVVAEKSLTIKMSICILKEWQKEKKKIWKKRKQN